jgi:mRNA-degrading endonuclease YafQ of YafQ-DinJ toxin-antitoxin module
MQIVFYPAFERVVKKLHPNAKQDLDKAVRELIENPLAGELKKGDLNGTRVYKFKMVRQLTLLAYIYDETGESIILLALGSHENFYRDLKKEI